MADTFERMAWLAVPKETSIYGRIIAAAENDDERLILMDLPDAELDALLDSGIIDEIAEHYEIVLDEYTQEFTGGDVEFLVDCAKRAGEDAKTFYAAANHAAKYNTGIFFSI